MEWIAFFLSVSAISLVVHEMETRKKLEKRLEELESQQK